MTTTEEQTCDWCGNIGHTADAHPLPRAHPHFDPDLDDNPLMEVALADFVDFIDRKSKPSPVAPTSPIGRLLGAPGTPPTCNNVVHWWPAMPKSGPCLCGEKRAEPNR